MKSFFVVALLVAAAVAAPAGPGGPDADAVVVRNDNDNIGVDGFNYVYETSNGIKGEAQGVVKNAGSENPALEVRGAFSYYDGLGVLHSIQYIANEDGFQPIGDDIPKAA